VNTVFIHAKKIQQQISAAIWARFLLFQQLRNMKKTFNISNGTNWKADLLIKKMKL